MKQVFLLHLLRKMGEESVEQLLAEVACTLLHGDGGSRESFNGVVGSILVCGEIFLLYLPLRLVKLRLKLKIRLLYYRGKIVVVGHTQGGNLTEGPISGIVIAFAVGAICIPLVRLCRTLIERDEHAQVCHAKRHVGHFADSRRQLRTYLHDMRLRGAEDAHGTVWLLAVGVEVRVVVGIVIVEAESLAQVCKGYFPFSLGKHGESVFLHIILYCRREHLL